MKLPLTSTVVIALGVLAGCASYPMPAQHMADAEAATRSANDLGANGTPQGQLHLRLANEEMTQAKALIANGDNERADYVLTRAKADAELAVAEAKDIQAQQEAQKAQQKIAELHAGNNTSSASSSSITTTTSATLAPAPVTGSTTTTVQTTTGGHK
jgi:hypothetical protein